MVIPHPYKSAPKSSFWSRAVATDWNPSEVVASHGLLIRKGDRVVSAGSCFASNIVPYLEKAGLTYLRTEATHPAFQDLEPEALGYANFSAAYGNIYTARQLLQLLKRGLKTFSPVEDRWPVGDGIVDPLRPGLRYYARTHREFDLLTAQHLRKTYEAFESADVFVFTLGLTEGWVSRLDGTVFPACPGTVAGSFDPERHEFKNFSVSEVIADLDEFIRLLRRVNPDVRLIITVSPVPLVATATGNHVLSASIYSKSVLRVAAGEITKCHPDITYFPAYEIVTGPQAPEDFFERDRRNVSQSGIKAVMCAMLAHCEVESQDDVGLPVVPLMKQSIWRENENGNGAIASKMSQLIADAECEEAMADPQAASIRSDLDARDVALQAALGQVDQFTIATEAARLESAASQSVLVQAQHRAAELVLAAESVKAENEKLRAECSALQEMVTTERAALDAKLNRTIFERDALAAESARWFEAVIAITADHNPLMPEMHGRHRWWKNFARRLSGNRRRPAPIVLADRARDAQRWELAARYYRDALDLEPNESRIWFQCGHALQAAGKASEAEVAFRKALELDSPPRHAPRKKKMETTQLAQTKNRGNAATA
jgi:tetratricopeptide (TPR) repeat protein